MRPGPPPKNRQAREPQSAKTRAGARSDCGGAGGGANIASAASAACTIRRGAIAICSWRYTVTRRKAVTGNGFARTVLGVGSSHAGAVASQTGTLGKTEEPSTILAGSTVCGDGRALILPSAALALWADRRHTVARRRPGRGAPARLRPAGCLRRLLACPVDQAQNRGLKCLRILTLLLLQKPHANERVDVRYV